LLISGIFQKIYICIIANYTYMDHHGHDNIQCMVVDRLCGVIISVLAMSAVDRGFEPVLVKLKR
jgi:hypothetical protein